MQSSDENPADLIHEDYVLEETPQPVPFQGRTVSGSADMNGPHPADLHPEWRSQTDMLSAIPPEAGIKRDPNGTLYRLIRRHTGEKIVQNGRVYNAVVQDRRRVALSLAEAARTDSDYWSPSFGWIRGGKKREQEHPSNLGSSAVQAIFELEEASPQEQASYAAAQAKLINPEILAAATLTAAPVAAKGGRKAA